MERAMALARRVAAVAQLNDEHRAYPGPGWVLSAGVEALGAERRAAITLAIKAYDAFGVDADPIGERSFGAFEAAGRRLVWVIEYYDLNYQHGSPNPGDPRVTRRLLKVMLAEEYRTGVRR